MKNPWGPPAPKKTWQTTSFREGFCGIKKFPGLLEGKMLPTFEDPRNHSLIHITLWRIWLLDINSLKTRFVVSNLFQNYQVILYYGNFPQKRSQPILPTQKTQSTWTTKHLQKTKQTNKKTPTQVPFPPFESRSELGRTCGFRSSSRRRCGSVGPRRIQGAAERQWEPGCMAAWGAKRTCDCAPTIHVLGIFT